MIGLHTPRLFDGESFHNNQVVLVEDGRIHDITTAPPSGIRMWQVPEHAVLAPGFVDLQVNGGGGIMFNDDTTPDGLRRIAAAHARTGSTSILPTLISGSREKLAMALAAARSAIAAKIPGIIGLHLEGPFLAHTRAGIHPPDAIIPMTDADVALLTAPFPASLMVTLAPEMVDPSMIARLAEAGVIVFAGHTDASWEQLQPALSAGLAGFTHLFNAMSQFAGRSPGAVGTALADGTAQAGIIMDGHHLHPASMRAAYAAMGAGRLFLVSDAMATAGSNVTGFQLGEKWIALRDGRLTDDAGTLAGAHLTMAEAVRNAVVMAGLPLGDALRMATSTPANAARRPDIGRIAPGCRADFVMLDAEQRVLTVWQGGVAEAGGPASADLAKDQPG